MSLPRRCRVQACRILRGSVCALVLLAQAVSVIGFPVLSARSGSLGSCQERACGCGDGVNARHACCCNPAVAQSPSCCSKPAKDSCCEQTDRHSAAAETDADEIHWVAGVTAQRCRGDGPLALQSFEPLLPPLAAGLPSCLFEKSDRLTIGSDSLPLFALDPPIPPPRLG